MASDRQFGEGERSLFLSVLSAHIFALNKAVDIIAAASDRDRETILQTLLRHGLNRARTSSPQILENACNQMLDLIIQYPPDESA